MNFLRDLITSLLQEMFALPSELYEKHPEAYRWVLYVIEKVGRPLIIYLFLAVFLRLFGKRVLAQLNPFDLVVYLSLANIVQNALIGPDNSVTGGLLGAFSLLVINWFVVRFVFRHQLLEKFFESKPTVLIEKGRLCRKRLIDEYMTESELLTVAHRQGYTSLDEIERCELDAGGAFFIRGKTPARAHSERQHADVMKRLDELSLQLTRMKS